MNGKKKIFILLMVFSSLAWAEDFGSAGALEKGSYDLEGMLQYAWEDEHMALAEYEAVMDKFDVTRPYANIAKSEETHIAYLKGLYEAYVFPFPKVDTDSHLVLPASLTEAAQIGVEAEIANIAMYEKFLKDDLPADVEEVFTFLKRASENHLAAFQRQTSQTAGWGRRR